MTFFPLCFQNSHTSVNPLSRDLGTISFEYIPKISDLTRVLNLNRTELELKDMMFIFAGFFDVGTPTNHYQT